MPTGVTLKEIHKETRLFSSINSYATFFANEIYRGVFNYGGMRLENFVPALWNEN